MIRFGVLGLGHIGKRHAQSISAHPGASLTHLADIKSQEECGATEFLENATWFDSLDTLISSDDLPDVVSVCTPNGLHANQCIKLLESGVNVVLEKPISLSLTDALRVKQASEATGMKVFCVMQNRFAPPSQWLKDLVDSGDLGQIRQVHIQCFWNRDDRYYQKGGWRGSLELDGGPLFTQFSHFIDVMYWIFGGISNPQARFYNQAHEHNTEFEDSGQISFDFENEGWGSFTFSTAVDRSNFESSLTLISEKGTLRIAGQYMQEVVHCDIDGYTMPDLPNSAPPNDYGAYKGSASNHHYVISNVVDCLTNGAEIATPLDEGVDVVSIIEAMYKAGERPIRKDQV
ncbi:MAG: oxidoreductase [Euryarchaeota archaeon]|nr:oxidoreductase [Euryarchaeota archaeon]